MELYYESEPKADPKQEESDEERNARFERYNERHNNAPPAKDHIIVNEATMDADKIEMVRESLTRNIDEIDKKEISSDMEDMALEADIIDAKKDYEAKQKLFDDMDAEMKKGNWLVRFFRRETPEYAHKEKELAKLSYAASSAHQNLMRLQAEKGKKIIRLGQVLANTKLNE
jgi:hypothetical protein